MTALKAHEVTRYINAPDLNRGAYLIYGPDMGLVREVSQKLQQFHSQGNQDPMSHITLDATELDADPSRLSVEAKTPSLFGGMRTIRIRNATKSLTATLSVLLDEAPADAIVIIEAGNLQKSDALRALAEKHKQARALPCYADNEEALAALIRSHFAEHQISIDNDVIATLRSQLGNDREVTRRELEKLSLYALDSKKLTAEDVILLCGDNAALAIDAILDAVGTGHVTKLDDTLVRATNSGIDAQRILSAALNHFSSLRRMRVQIDAGKQPRDVLNSARPRPHFSRMSAMERQLRLWTDHRLASATTRIYEAIAESRKTGNLGSSIAHRALLAVCVSAAHH